MKKILALFIAATALTGCSGWPDGLAPQSSGDSGQFSQAPSFYQSPYDDDRQAFVNGQPSSDPTQAETQTTLNNEALYYADKAWNADNIRDRDTNFSKYLLAKQRQSN